MKYSPLLPQVALVFAVVYACTDSTAPARFLTPKDPAHDVGDPPPPPVDVAMTITVESPGSALFTGVYFSNGKISDDGLPEPTFDGTAWLRLNNKQPDPNGTASANTRFKRQDDNKSGMGTLTFVEFDPVEGDVSVTYTITSVEEFTSSPNSDCAVNFQTCVFIRFKATSDKDDDVHDGQLRAYNVQGCTLQTGDGFYFDCPGSEEG